MSGPKFSVNLPASSSAVPDAEDDDVALVALDVLEVLDEEAVEAVLGEEVVEVRALAARGLELVADAARLRLGEGDDAERRDPGGVRAWCRDALDDLARLDRVVARSAPSVDAVGHVE